MQLTIGQLAYGDRCVEDVTIRGNALTPAAGSTDVSVGQGVKNLVIIRPATTKPSTQPTTTR